MARKILFYKRYFYDFFDKQTEKTKEKIDYVLDMVASVDRVPEQYLKHIEGTSGLYEIRVQQGNNIFRIFCCFDEGKLLFFLTAFRKKPIKHQRAKLKKH